MPGFPSIDDPAGDSGMDSVQLQFRGGDPESGVIRTESMVEWLLVIFVSELAKHGDLRSAASVAMMNYLDASEADENKPRAES